MPVLPLPILLIAVLALAGACSSGKDGSSGDDPETTADSRASGDVSRSDEETDGPSPTPTLDPEAENALAESLLLSVNDFPTGWAETPDEDEEEGAFDECDLGPAPGRTGHAESGSFSDGGAAELYQILAVFDNAENATSSLTRFEENVDCVLDVINDGNLDEDGVEYYNAKIGSLSFPSFGDATKAYRLEVEFKAETIFGSDSEGTLYLDYVDVSEDRFAFIIQASDIFSPFDTTMLEEMVSKAAERLTADE